jgi:hypothetical protein
MNEPLTIYAIPLSACCGAKQQLVQSRRGGFVSKNCECCERPRAVNIIELPDLYCTECGSTCIKSTSRFDGNYIYTCPCCHITDKLYKLIPYWHQRYSYHGLATPNERGY